MLRNIKTVSRVPALNSYTFRYYKMSNLVFPKLSLPCDEDYDCEFGIECENDVVAWINDFNELNRSRFTAKKQAVEFFPCSSRGCRCALYVVRDLYQRIGRVEIVGSHNHINCQRKGNMRNGLPMKSMAPFPMAQELSICTARLMIVYESAELRFLEIRSQIPAGESVHEVVQALSSYYHINDDEESEDDGSLDERLVTC